MLRRNFVSLFRYVPFRQCHVPATPVTVPSWYKLPEDFSHVVYPPFEKTLPAYLKKPIYLEEEGFSSKSPPDMTKRLIEIRGPELYHNELRHKQYGMVAVRGGMLEFDHFESIRKSINHEIENVPLFKDAFAVWRVDAPWLPKYKRASGVKLGGGKPKAPHHYVTPVRSGRVIFELGGRIVYDQARKLIEEQVGRMPMLCRFVSYEEMLEEDKNIDNLKTLNRNPFNFEFCMKWNMQNCSQYLKPYDYQWGGYYI